MVKPVKIKILDYEYMIKGEEDLDQVFRIADFVNAKIKEAEECSPGISEKRKVILAALNIASDYFNLLNNQDNKCVDIEQRSKALIYNIDSAIK